MREDKKAFGLIEITLIRGAPGIGTDLLERFVLLIDQHRGLSAFFQTFQTAAYYYVICFRHFFFLRFG